MGIGGLLDQVRDYYVSRFIDVLNEHAAAEGVSIVHEPAFRDGDVVTEGRLALPTRGDLLLIRDGEVSESLQIDTDGMLAFEPIEFDWPANNVGVELRPFQWNWMQLRISGLQPDVDWAPLRGWFIDWFQSVDPADNELLGGVHFMSGPQDDGDDCQLAIDLGTAPVEAFEELLDALGQMGADHLQIGQFGEGE